MLLTQKSLGIFFFSSRRRHTRYWRDWSSDVCSSDLLARQEGRRDPGDPPAAQGRYNPVHLITREERRIAPRRPLETVVLAPEIRDQRAWMRGTISESRSEERRVGKECSSG